MVNVEKAMEYALLKNNREKTDFVKDLLQSLLIDYFVYVVVGKGYEFLPKKNDDFFIQVRKRLGSLKTYSHLKIPEPEDPTTEEFVSLCIFVS